MKIKGRQQVALFLFLLGMICLLSGTSYAFYEVLYEGRTENKLEAGSFAIAFENKSNTITLDNAYPMSDEEGNNLDPFRFSITNNGTLASKYQLSIEEDSKNTLSRGYLKYSLKRNNEEITSPSTLSSLIIVDNQTLAPEAVDNYELRIWIDYNTPNEAMNQIWKGKIKLVAHDNGVQYIEDHIAPTIELESKLVMTIEKGGTFTDPGVKSVTDNVDKTIDKSKVTIRYEYYDGDKVSTVTGVDTGKEGVYIIYYEIKDESGNKGVVARTVNVVQVNKNAPTITLIGESTLTYARGNYYVEPGATAKDEQNNDLTNQMITIHNLNLNIEEDQVVKYFVIDKDGNIGGNTRNIHVVPAYKDNTNANEPKIVEGMIPVKWDEGLQKWVKVDMIDQWYNYEIQEWANAVTVSETRRKEYQTAAKDTPIEMDDINTMWVWIPRYEYNYVSIANYAGGTQAQPGEIKVNFISGTSSKVSDEYNYKMHPAFTFGDKELTGIWCGKFEPSNEEGIYGDNNDEKANDAMLTPIIKPNVPSWRNIQVANAFYASRKMQTEKYDVYGFPNNETYDTHMSKNSEWGAVAYLSQSKYGKYGKDKQEVYINNCSQFITGIAGNTASESSSAETCKTNTYETEAGQKASTTGNIYGIYDMHGGARDYVMGALNDNGKPKIASSGFTDDTNENTKLPNAKYYDLYTSANPDSDDVSSYMTACNNGVCYGHALSETARWYWASWSFITSSSPWLMHGGRGGGSGSGGIGEGMYRVDHQTGAMNSVFTFRLMLAP